MPVTYTNRKGTTYTLCRSTTKTGKPRYHFVLEPEGRDVVKAIPRGWEIRESVNGVVSLAKQRPRQIGQDEVASVRAALERHPKDNRYRVNAKSDQIVVYEQLGPDIEEILEMFGDLFGPDAHAMRQLQETMAERARYTPILRFLLVDGEKRIFAVERMSYLGEREDWLDIDRHGPIGPLAQELIPTLDTDDFFELY